MTKSKSFQSLLQGHIHSKQEAIDYLNAALREEDLGVFFLALKDVVTMFGGMHKLAELTDLNRESLYRSLSKKGNPQFTTVEQILEILGFELLITEKQPQRKAS